MCGIAGIYDLLGDRPIDRPLLERMNGLQTHRGPDGDGFHFEPGVGLGHRRLAIIDPGAGGYQPMVSADSRHVIVFNGEIYNFLELRRELEV